MSDLKDLNKSFTEIIALSEMTLKEQLAFKKKRREEHKQAESSKLVHAKS